MAKEQYIVGLDLGTYAVRVVQAKVNPETGAVAVVGAGVVQASGMRKGVIVDIDEAVSAISQALEKVERMTGVPVTRARVSVGGTHLLCLESKGVIAVSKPDGEITESDIVRVVDAAQAISIPPNREVLHVIPKSFTVDGQTGIKDPLGMTGIRLEVETIMVHGGIPYLKNLSRAVLQAGVEIEELIVAPLAAAASVLSRRQKELGVAVVDLGAGTTSMAVYEEGNLLHTAILPVGGMHITNDIAIGLRCSIDTAERVKLLFGHALPADVDARATVDLSKIDAEETESVSRGEVLDIMEARLEEIFDYVGRELKKIGRDGKLPAGIVLTGGGSNVPGILEFTKKELKLPAALGAVQGVETIIDRVEDMSFATVVGLVLFGDKGSTSGNSGAWTEQFSRLQNSAGVRKLQQWFKSFLP